jgi:hypothetical protein
LKVHYRWYCKTLKDVIREAKKQYYNKQVLNFGNKIKTVWNITRSVTGKLTKGGYNTGFKKLVARLLAIGKI